MSQFFSLVHLEGLITMFIVLILAFVLVPRLIKSLGTEDKEVILSFRNWVTAIIVIAFAMSTAMTSFVNGVPNTPIDRDIVNQRASNLETK